MSEYNECFDQLYDNYYHKLTNEQKEWLDDFSELTCCDKCGLIQRWEGEVYCKGDFDWEENVNCHPYEVLCNACYYENSRTLKARLTIAYYKSKDLLLYRGDI